MSSSPSTPTSTHSSGHVTSVFSQGPPSQNTRSSVMNRTLPNTTPPASYQVAIRHIADREAAIAASASVASRHRTPSPPFETINHGHPEVLPPSTSYPPTPPSTLQNHLPDSSLVHHHSTPLRPPPLSIRQPSSSYTSTTNTFNQPSPMTVDPSLVRHQMMQEHMDTMHSDIASLGHKHDHTMTRIGELNENIGALQNNIGGIDSNVNALKNLLLNLGQKLNPTARPPPPELVPSVLLPHHPSSVPSNVPRNLPHQVQQNMTDTITGNQTQVPHRVPLGNIQSMSQTSSFTSMPSSLPVRLQTNIRANIPIETALNNVSNNQDIPLGSDISLSSEKDQKTVNRPIPHNLTGPNQHCPPRPQETVFSPIQDSRNFPATQNPTSILMSASANQSHTPVINNSGFHNNVTSPTGHSQFNSNHFILVLDNVLKIKYGAIETSLTKRQLDDDSNQSMKKLYESIIRSLNIGFSTDLYFLPTFDTLSSTISFSNYFLTGLIGSNYDKAMNVFNQLGQLIKDRISHHECVDKIKCPKAYLIIHTYLQLNGWELLEKLFKHRLVNCGALADTDLDSLRVNLLLQPQESIHSFFQRTQSIENEYAMQMNRHSHLVPRFKLIRRFVSELMRAREYQTYISDYHKLIIKHVKIHGEHTNTNVSFTLIDIYDDLTSFAVISTPAKLDPSPNNISGPPLHYPSTSPSINDTMPLIAYTDVGHHYDEWYDSAQDCTDPVIAAAMHNTRLKKFCQACMTPGHESDRCFLRGPNFRPKELSQRLNVFNQQNGDAPPPGTVLPIWNPRSPPPMLNKGNKLKGSQPTKSRPVDNRPTRPFTNAQTKSSGTPKPTASINHLNVSFTDDKQPDFDIIEDDIKPSLSAFITHQQNYINDFDNASSYTNDSDIDVPIIATFNQTRPSPAVITSTSFNFKTKYDQENPVYTSTPLEICTQIEKVHHQRSDTPSSAFFRQFSTNLTTLSHSTFATHSQLTMQVDSGANVNATTDKNMLFFYIPTVSTVEAVNGETFTSIGWGGMLLHIDDNKTPFLCCPVYVCPQNPRNTFSLGALKTYSKFKRAIADTHISVDLVTHDDRNHHYSVRTSNGLDFIDVTVVKFRTIDSAPSISLLNQPLPDRSIVFKQNEIDRWIFDKNVMILIATYYVHLHHHQSPREQAIIDMNTVLHRRYLPPKTQMISQFSTTTSSILTVDNNISSSNDSKIVPIVGKMFRSALISKPKPLQSYMVLHLLLQHASKSMILKIIKSNSLSDIPDFSKIGNFDCSCAICNISKATKLPKGKLVDVTNLPPFQRLHIDFSFFGVTSLRGYTTALDITCASTSYPFGFPTKSKSPPLDLFKWFVTTIRNMGHQVTFIRVDEDKGLARSTEFCELVVKLNCVLETTGGGNSLNNGKVERQNRSKADMVRSALATGNLLFGNDLPSDMKIEEFWCFAYQHACYTMRVLYNRMRKSSSYILVHQTIPTVNRLAIWGSYATAIDHNKNQMPKLSTDRAKSVQFLSFGNNTSNILYWCRKNPRKWYRCHHAIIDQVRTFNALKHIFSTIPDEPDNIHPSDPKIRIIDLPCHDTPFPISDIITVKFVLPSPPCTIGFLIKDDELLNLPFISGCEKGSPAWIALPPRLRRQSFILNINGEGPITARFAVDLLRTAQQTQSRMLEIDLIKRKHDKTTPLSITRAMFDQLPSLIQNRPVINSASIDTYGNYSQFITSPVKPTKPKSFFECLKGPFRENWMAAARQSFEKNRKVGVFSIPFRRSELPKDTNVFRSLLVPDFKPTDIPNVYKCKVRDCTVGTNQVKGVDFPESYCAVVDATTFRLMMCMSASLGYTVAIIDVENAFQTSIAPEEYRIFVTIPVTYLKWLRETEDFDYDQNETYVRQMFNANQGTKAASHIWYWLLVPILAKYGFNRSTVDHAFLIKAYEDGTYFYICLATDDLLCAFRDYKYFHDLVLYLKRFFNLTVQTGHILSFLSLRIIQTEHAISVDQGEYIYDLVLKYYGKDIDRIKTVTTPMRSDSAFEKELFESPALTNDELVHHALEYKGSYRYHTGKFQFAVTWTRFDLGFSVQRLAEYNNTPTSVAFEAIARHYRYLAGDIIRPLTYPRHSLSGTTTISYFVSPEKSIELHLPNDLQLYTDSEFARNLSDRRSYYCVIFVLLNVAIQCKVKKSDTIAGHTTDAEMKGTYAGVRRLLPLRRILESMGFPCRTPTPLYVDNAAVSAIIDAKRMTPRCRHLDIPIAYLHEQHGKSFDHRLISTLKMLADLGTKPLVLALHRRFKYWACGHYFLPPEGSDHYKFLQLQFYEKSFVEIQKAFRT